MPKHLDLYVQPAYNYDTKEIEYAEILIRKYNGINSVKSILEHIKLFHAEKQFDLEVLDSTLKLMAQVKDIKYTIGVNLCPSTILIENVSKQILELIDSYNIDHSKLIIEVNEASKFGNENVINNIKNLRENGIKIALDDFGVEKATLGSLVTNDFDIIKVDKMLVSNLGKEHENSQTAILKLSLKLFEELNVKHIVEGIETDKQLNYIRGLGYTVVQGFLYEKPMPIKKYFKKFEEVEVHG